MTISSDPVPGDYVGGRFLDPIGAPLISSNPARDGAPVVRTSWAKERVDEAVAAAKAAQPAWSRLSLDERLAALHRFRAVIQAKKEHLADAIVLEIGKIRPEARVEIDSLIGRFDLVAAQIRQDLRDGPLPGFPNEALRWHPHGVVGVIGPFNFPLHLCHAHVVPALLLGNTVVMKPSETAPLCGIRYAEAAHEAGLPPGVLDVVQGKGPTGAAMVAHPDVHGLAFTGSWPVGRRITEAALDKPEMLIALEMGGKNTVVVCEDADIRQAAHEIVVGGYLTTGQRCTCTDRVLVHRALARPLIDALRRIVSSLKFGDPDDATAFAGPMATEDGRNRLERAIAAAQAAGADAVVPGARIAGGFYRSGSFHVLPDGLHDVPGYTDTELFGPDIGIEMVQSDDEAIAIISASPYGFANSIFTPDDRRFDRYYRETRCGIVNRNRSTNQASPRLPFGGTGRSGNFRPAGSFAARNLAIPVAVQSNSVLSMTTHAHLRALLPGHDLDRLEQMHEREERADAQRAIDAPRMMRVLRPLGGALPESTKWLERLYAGDRVPREKKLPVFDHARSHGAYFVSVDPEPLSVLDAMGQTATLPFGFSHEALVRAYVEGTFGDTILRAHDTTLPIEDLEGPGQDAAAEYAMALRALVPGLPTVCFAASGAEANEKALALCRLAGRESATRVLAFEGSFHGRTLLALYASHSPSKRIPFEITGYEATFAPWPTWNRAGDAEPAEPAGFREACARADASALRALSSAADPLLDAEITSLSRVIEEIGRGSFIAVIVEPMQSEGGDRYATARFHRGLRLITRALGVPLIMDEVQCGFGLGGKSFAWHRSFGLVDAQGRSDQPDCVTFAKRAQVGVVLTRFADPEPTQAYAASMIRGRLHAALIAESDAASRIEAALRARLPDLERRWSQRIANVRCRGFALAFDLGTPAELEAYLGQRFWRGAIVFGAGDRTVRYRLGASFSEREIDLLFRTIHQSLAWLEAHPGKKPPEWEDLGGGGGGPTRSSAASELRLRRVGVAEVEDTLPRLLELEARVYEPARQDPPDRLRLGFEDPHGIAILAELRDGEAWKLVGYSIAAPLERVPDVAGPDRDPARGRGDTLYSVALTVDPAMQGAGIGRRLKREQLAIARTISRDDGTPRYRWVTGRNRVGHADAMTRLNDSFGAFTALVLDKQYGEDAQARYYRQPIGPLAVEGGPRRAGAEAARVDLASGLIAPLADPPESLVRSERDGLLAGPAVNKLTLVNYVTPAIVRAIEHVAALAPDLPHVYLTSGRDEIVDKAIRLLRFHRKQGRVVISLEGAYVGHTTACARSVSDPSTHRQGAPHFSGWPRAPHPEIAGDEVTIAAIRETIAREGADAVIAIVIEAIQERTGRTISPAFASRLAALRAETKVPIVVIDTAGAYYRGGSGAFASSGWELVPDVRGWWTGGQLGILHVDRPHFVGTPLTFVSTWDGDELSLIQMHHQLRAARTIDIAAATRSLDQALAVASERAVPARGAGLYRVLAAGDRGDAIADGLRAHGIVVRRFPGGNLAIAPALDRVVAHASALGDALRTVLR
jgi:RHH-type proline utilization regulon transcriptional repressor/proline dehydrogenase/delta 1-pyrroline-5-carboxylate dehydrogenase